MQVSSDRTQDIRSDHLSKRRCYRWGSLTRLYKDPQELRTLPNGHADTVSVSSKCYNSLKKESRVHVYKVGLTISMEAQQGICVYWLPLRLPYNVVRDFANIPS